MQTKTLEHIPGRLRQLAAGALWRRDGGEAEFSGKMISFFGETLTDFEKYIII